MIQKFVALSLELLLATTVAAAQDVKPPVQGVKTAAAGVYSRGEADRGRTVVQTHCASCHGEDLTGVEAPALSGSGFMLKWENRPLATLFRKIRDTMPAASVTSVTEDEKLDALAYVLQQNGFPAGDGELPHEIDALASIQLTRQDGPAPPRTGSLVRVTGCLSQGAGAGWTLTSASEPRTASIDSPSPSDAALLGTETVRLLNVFPDPSPHKGHKMEVSGLLVRDGAGAGVNVLSMEMLAPACEK